jgi:carboxymethylenebutenolidase
MAADIESTMTTVNGLNAYLSRPAGGSPGGMLVIPMISGISGQVKEFADGIAAAGVTALSWDPWRGRPSGDETPFDTLGEWMGQLDDEVSLTELATLTDHLFGELGCQRVGAIGWCMGGRFALLHGARDQRLASIVAYHPTVPGTPAANHTISAVDSAAAIGAPVMMLYPGQDHLVPQESFQALQTALHSRAEAASLIHLYPGAEHGFSAKGRHGNPVNKAAADLAWPQALAFIRSTTLA